MISAGSLKNTTFLRNIYRKGVFEGHALCCSPQMMPISEVGDFTLSDEPVDKWVRYTIEDYHKWVTLQHQVADDSVLFARVSTGTHIYAAAFGCKVHCPKGDVPFAMPLVHNATEADLLQEPDIWKSPTLYRVFELIEKVRRELGDDVYISVPDIQSGFDTAALIWDKTDFYCAMATAPDAVKRLVKKCSSVLKKFVAELRLHFPMLSPCHCPAVWAPPEMGPWFSNDECGTISVNMFDEFCLPELIDISHEFGGLGMHCCANAEHQFESFKKIPNFYAFNRVSAKYGFMPIIEQFSEVNSPVHVLAWISEDEIAQLIKCANSHTRFIFNLINASPEEAKPWYEQMRKLCPRTD
jgi:hypothetical protein